MTSSNNAGGSVITIPSDTPKKNQTEFKINRPSACVGCGFCCEQAPCPFGEWDKERHQCSFLLDKNEKGQRFCSKYEEIAVEANKPWISPAFGAGCSSSFCNTRREDLLRDLAPLQWILWNFSPGHYPDALYKEFTYQIAAHLFEIAEAEGEPISEGQRDALKTFRAYLDGEVPYEEVSAARQAGWNPESLPEGCHWVTVAALFLMDSLGVVVKAIAMDLLGDENNKWLAQCLYDLIENHNKAKKGQK